MKIVNNYITKNDIKAITIEESREKLVITEKVPQAATNSQEFNSLDIEIKREPEANPVIQEQIFSNDLDSSVEPEILIKEEVEVEEVTIKQEPVDVDENPEQKSSNDDDFQEPSTSQDLQESPTQSVDQTENSDSKIDQILKLNQDIFNMISSLDHKFDDYKGKMQNSEIIPYLLNQDAIRPLRK